MLSTKILNIISLYLNIHVMQLDNGKHIEKITAISMKSNKKRKLDTDGDNTYNILNNKFKS